MTMRNLFALLGAHRARYLLVIACAAASSGIEAVLHPLLTKAIFDAVTVKNNFHEFIYLGLAYFGMGLVLNAANHFISLWKMRVDNRVAADVSSTLLSTYYNKNYANVLRDGSGYYVARIHSDVRDGLLPMLATFRNIVISTTSFLVLIFVLVYISWQAFVILSIVIPLSAVVSVLVSKKIRSLTDVERDTEAALIDVLTRSVGAFKMVKSFAILPQTVRAYSDSVNNAQDSTYRKFRVVRSLQTAGDLTMVISDSSSILVGAYLVFRNQMTLGSFIAFMNAFWRSATTLVSIFNMWADLHGYGATVDRLSSFINEPAHAPYHDVGRDLRATAIGYSYESGPVLSDMSLHVKAGESCLIVGHNGSGKTTLANILCGYLSPSTGQLELPARVSGITLPVHFPPTRLQDLPVDLELLAGLGLEGREVLEARPDFLSAGQQQKIALALALAKDADLYVLDEPLANLDASSRIAAMREIKVRTQGRILVMIMHNADEFSAMFDQVCSLGATCERRELALN